MSAVILTAIKTVVEATGEFLPSSVVINDWSFLDDTQAVGPWCRIETAGVSNAGFPMNGRDNTYLVPVVLVSGYYGEWDVTMAELARLRTAIIDTVRGDNTALPSIGDGLYRSVERIYDNNAAAPVQPVLTAAFLESLESGDGIPDYLQLQMTWEIQETC